MSTNRRSILAGAALAAAPIAIAAAQTQRQPGLDPAAIPAPDVSGVRTARQFAMAVIGPAELSRVTSQLAVCKGPLV